MNEENRPSDETGAAQELGRAQHQDTATRPHPTTDDWDRVASGEIGLHEISPSAFRWYTLGHEHGVNAMTETVLQAKRDADRMALFAMNGPERGAEIQHRLDRALAACPPDIEPFSEEYFAHVLSGALSGGAA